MLKTTLIAVKLIIMTHYLLPASKLAANFALSRLLEEGVIEHALVPEELHVVLPDPVLELGAEFAGGQCDGPQVGSARLGG